MHPDKKFDSMDFFDNFVFRNKNDPENESHQSWSI